jgi:hypothetical protein
MGMLPMWVVLLVLPLPIHCLHYALDTLQRHNLLLLRGLCIIRFWHPYTFVLLQNYAA